MDSNSELNQRLSTSNASTKADGDVNNVLMSLETDSERNMDSKSEFDQRPSTSNGSTKVDAINILPFGPDSNIDSDLDERSSTPN